MASFTNDIDLLARLSGYGDLTSAYRNLLGGINHRNFGGPVPFNAENHGFVFFTRPGLNLSYDNVKMDRHLHPFLSPETASLERAIRVMLDPVSARGYEGTNTYHEPVISDLFDTRQAFIPLLSNNIISASGWPDQTMQYTDSAPGPVKEAWTHADDIIDVNYPWDMSCNFRNVLGDPITLMLLLWMRYISNVRRGYMTPWPTDVIENRIDYQTGIWRFTMDPGRRFIQKWSRTIGSPQTIPIGAAMDYSTDGPFNLNNANQISMQFHCIGAEYMDPILLTEFNLTVMAFNPDMYRTRRVDLMVQIPYDELTYFNFRGFPWIDVKTRELRWYVYKTEYEQMRAELLAGGHTADTEGPANADGTPSTNVRPTTYSMHNPIPKTAEDPR